MEDNMEFQAYGAVNHRYNFQPQPESANESSQIHSDNSLQTFSVQAKTVKNKGSFISKIGEKASKWFGGRFTNKASNNKKVKSSISNNSQMSLVSENHPSRNQLTKP